MAKLKNFSGADMAKEFNDVYGKVDLDYANEFNEFNAEREIECAKLDQKRKEYNNEFNTGGCEST
jgi:hypothetical protein